MKRCIFFVLLTSKALFAIDEGTYNVLPGYRDINPEQMLSLDSLATTHQKNTHGTFAFRDTTASINKFIHKNSDSNFSVTCGLRNVHMQLGTHLRSNHITYGVLGSSLEYRGMPQWQWSINASIQPDIERFDLVRTTRYIGSLQGRYQQTKRLNWLVGTYIETGMRATTVQPIVGLEYKNTPWEYQAIYPFKAGISYTGIPHNIFSIMIRSIYTAAKVEKGFSHHPAVVLYKATGAELRWDLPVNSLWLFWASIGHTFTNKLCVGNKNFHQKKEITLRQTPYAQIGINIAI